MKKFLSIFMAVVLILTVATPAFAADTPTQKEEVVYGLLGSDGGIQNIYVVNSLNGGMITDYGNYSEVSNMTTSEKMEQNGDRIMVKTTADRFYYQGTLQTKALPWNIDIRYELGGKEFSASELAGKNGALEIAIAITQNKAINPVFYENYILQVSLTLDTERCTDIVSPNATIASAGKDKVIAHTILPGNDSNITVAANVHDFIMGGIEITAMPLAMLIEIPGTDSLTEDMTSLADAVSDLNDGAKELSDGIAKTYSGARKLTEGSSDFAGGLSELSGNSKEMLGASAQISTALNTIVKALEEGSGNLDSSNLAALPDGLRQLADGLTGITNGMQTLKYGYASAYVALDSAISSIPSADIDPSRLYAAVSGDDALSATLDQLVAYYAAAKTVKGTYAAVQDAFASVAGSLDDMSGSVGTMASTLLGLADEIARSLSEMDFVEKMQQLKSGLSQLSDNYNQFHAGLDEYMIGIKRLANGYGEVNAGVRSLTNGIGEINTGASRLYEGTSELNDVVADLPNSIQIEIDEIMKQYDKSDFTPVSFVSEKNTSVTAVQFVLKTAPIEVIEMVENAATAPVKLIFWQKLLKLFGLYP